MSDGAPFFAGWRSWHRRAKDRGPTRHRFLVVSHGTQYRATKAPICIPVSSALVGARTVHSIRVEAVCSVYLQGLSTMVAVGIQPWAHDWLQQQLTLFSSRRGLGGSPPFHFEPSDSLI